MFTFNLSLAALLVIVSAAAFLIHARRTSGVPPGPTGIPILGNIFQVSKDSPWLACKSLANKYGDVVQIHIFGQPILLLTSPTATRELLEKRGSIYSDRPRMILSGEMLGYEHAVPTCRYGPRYRTYRRLLQDGLSPQKYVEFCRLREAKTCKLLTMLKTAPNDFRTHLRLAVASIVFSVTHGYNVMNKDDYFIEIATKALQDWTDASSIGSVVADLLPILKYIPGLDFKAKTEQKRQNMVNVRDWPFALVKSQIENGTYKPSFTASLLTETENLSSEDIDIYKWVSMSLFGGGLDTTFITLYKFLLAMALFPAVQERAQEELDRVVGPDRLPNLGDRSRLSYIQKLVWELWRWYPLAPLAVPHRLMQDDVYRGYHLKKGTIVVGNTWGILHDPELYPNPSEFNPARYDSSTSDLNPDPRAWSFGYGRRVCPGLVFAEDTVFTVVVSILAVFSISGATDMQGRPLDEFPPNNTGVVCQPSEFNCKITSRSLTAEKLLDILESYHHDANTE